MIRHSVNLIRDLEEGDNVYEISTRQTDRADIGLVKQKRMLSTRLESDSDIQGTISRNDIS